MDENVPQEDTELCSQLHKIYEFISQMRKSANGQWIGDGPSPPAIQTLYNVINEDFAEILDSLWNGCAPLLELQDLPRHPVSRKRMPVPGGRQRVFTAAFDEALNVWAKERGLATDWFIADVKYSLKQCHDRATFSLTPWPMPVSPSTIDQVSRYSNRIHVEAFTAWNPLKRSRAHVEAELLMQAWASITAELNAIESRLKASGLDQVHFEQSTIERDMPRFIRRHMLRERPRQIARDEYLRTPEGIEEREGWKESVSTERATKDLLFPGKEVDIIQSAQRIARLLCIDLSPLPKGPEPRRAR